MYGTSESESERWSMRRAMKNNKSNPRRTALSVDSMLGLGILRGLKMNRTEFDKKRLRERKKFAESIQETLAESAVLEAGGKYGFCRMIDLLQKEWVRVLMKEGLSKKTAIKITKDA